MESAAFLVSFVSAAFLAAFVSCRQWRLGFVASQSARRADTPTPTRGVFASNSGCVCIQLGVCLHPTRRFQRRDALGKGRVGSKAGNDVGAEALARAYGEAWDHWTRRTSRCPTNSLVGMAQRHQIHQRRPKGFRPRNTPQRRVTRYGTHRSA